jgi:hypothetical protein
MAAMKCPSELWKWAPELTASAMDARNPIRDPNHISKVTESGLGHPCQLEDDSESQRQSDDSSTMNDRVLSNRSQPPLQA